MSSRAAWLALHAAVLLFGTAGLFARWLPVTPANLVFGRTLIAAAALAVAWRLRAPAARVGPGLPLLMTGPLLAIHWTTFFEAIQVSTVAIGLLGYASFPLFTVLFSLLSGQRPTRREVSAAAAVTLGLVLLVPNWSLAERAVLGLGWGLVSGASFAALTLANRRFAGRADPVLLALAQNAVAALCLAPWISWPLVAGASQWLGLLALGVVWTALSHTLFIAALRQVAAPQAAVVASLEPAYGIVLAWWLLGEVPGVREWLGGLLIVGVSAWLTASAARKRA